MPVLPGRWDDPGFMRKILAGTLDDYDNTMPALPPSGVKLFARHRARRLPAFVGPTGQDSQLQPAFFSNRVWRVMSQAAVSLVAPDGLSITSAPAPTVGSPAPASGFRNGMLRNGFATTTTANTPAGWRASSATPAYLSTTQNAGGFFFVCRFGISAHQSTSRFFVGLHTITTQIPGATDPSALLNTIGFGWDAADTELQFMHNDGAGTATKVALGANFPKSSTTNVYEVRLFAPSGGGQQVFYHVLRLNDGVTSGNPAAVTTNLPALNTLMTMHFNLSNGGNAAVASVDFMQAYLELDN